VKCCLCGNEIEKKYTPEGKMYWDGGNNAEPVKSGRCCDACDWSVVIPARMRKHQEYMKGVVKNAEKEKSKTKNDI